MFATSVRVRPWSARSWPRSVGRVTRICPSCCSMDMRWGTTWLSSPRGPLTWTRPGEIATFTPAGTSIGCLPIRLMAMAPGSPDEAEDLAADTLLLGGAARDEPRGGGQDSGAHATEDARKAILARIDAAPGLRDALDVGDDPLAVAPVLELDHEHGMTGAIDLVVLDVALLLHELGDALLEAGVRHRRGLVHRLVGVADAGEHVGDGIGQHLCPPTTSSSSCRG